MEFDGVPRLSTDNIIFQTLKINKHVSKSIAHRTNQIR